MLAPGAPVAQSATLSLDPEFPEVWAVEPHRNRTRPLKIIGQQPGLGVLCRYLLLSTCHFESRDREIELCEYEITIHEPK
jgi:hypothetical protein